MQSLRSLYDRQVWVSTHSPVVLATTQLSELLITSLDRSGAASVVAGEKHPRLATWKGAIDARQLVCDGSVRVNDLLFFVADKNMAESVSGLLERKQIHRIVGCGAFHFDARRDIKVAAGQNDPGLYVRANELLRRSGPKKLRTVSSR